MLNQPTLDDKLIVLSAFNAAYCYILLIIENIYFTDVPPLREGLVAGMFLLMKQIMPGLHNVITGIDLPGKGVKMAPLYLFYDFTNIPPPLNTLVNSADSPKQQLTILLQATDSKFSPGIPLAKSAKYLPEVIIHTHN